MCGKCDHIKSFAYTIKSNALFWHFFKKRNHPNWYVGLEITLGRLLRNSLGYFESILNFGFTPFWQKFWSFCGLKLEISDILGSLQYFYLVFGQKGDFCVALHRCFETTFHKGTSTVPNAQPNTALTALSQTLGVLSVKISLLKPGVPRWSLFDVWKM